MTGSSSKLAAHGAVRWAMFPLLLLASVSLSCSSTTTRAVDGRFDARAWRPAVDGPIRLDGTWDFYWRQLLPAATLTSREFPAAKKLPITVPRFWHRVPVGTANVDTADDTGREATAGSGFGTYRLRVRLPADTPPLALRLGNVNSAVEVYAQGQRVWQAGRVGTDRSSQVSAYRPGVALLPAVEAVHGVQVLDLIVHTSTYINSRGGLDDPVWLGLPNDLIAARTRSLAGLGLVVGGLLMMGLYHLLLYVLRRRSKISLYFGLTCLAALGRLGFSNELLFLELWPDLSWNLVVRGMYFFAYAIFGTFALYLQGLWPRAVPSWVYRAVIVAAAVGALSALLTPVAFFTQGLSALEFFVVGSLVLACFVFLGAQRHKEEGRWIYAAGFAFIAVGALHDVVASQGLLSAGLYLGPLGIFVFLFAQATILARRFARSLATEERQRGELQELVDRFERERRERERYEELSLAASGLAHETKNPLGIIRGLAQRLVAAPDAPESTRRRAGQILDQADRAASRLGDFLSYARLRDPKIAPVDFEALLKYAREILAPDLEAKSASCRIEAAGARVLADEEMLLQVVLNLMLNGIAASETGDVLELRFTPDDGARGKLAVVDHGIGIAPEMIERVRKPYVTGRADGHGLGLALVERLAELHGWSLHIESELGVGTRVEIDGISVDPERVES